MAKRAEPLYFLAFYLSQRSQYSLAWYYASLAAKILNPAISAALFIPNDIYNYWVDYELASLSHHIFPSQPTLGMQAAMAFWNNGYAPDCLRWSFSSSMKSYVRPIMASANMSERWALSIGVWMPCPSMARTLSCGNSWNREIFSGFPPPGLKSTMVTGQSPMITLSQCTCTRFLSRLENS
jgi:hypothetical protein